MVKFLPALSLMLVSGCTDPMSSSDGIWPAAGVAQATNLNNQTTGTTPIHDWRASPGGSGPRAARVLQDYQTSPGQAIAPGAASPD